MSEGKGSQIGTLLITGLLAILGTVAGGVMKGYWDSSLAEKKFQADLVMKALEAEEPEARVNSLRFMIKTKLIASSNIQEGLEAYLKEQPSPPKEQPSVVPQFKPSAVSSLPSIVVPRNEETSGYTDFDLFVCDAAWEDAQAKATAQTVINTLQKAGRVGQISLKKWSSYEEIPLEKLRNKLTIIVDKGYGETRELPRLKQQFQAVGSLPEIQVLDNTGSTTPWLISLVTCLSK